MVLDNGIEFQFGAFQCHAFDLVLVKGKGLVNVVFCHAFHVKTQVAYLHEHPSTTPFVDSLCVQW